VGKQKAVLIAAHLYLMLCFFGFFMFLKIAILGNFYYLVLGTWVNCGLFVIN